MDFVFGWVSEGGGDVEWLMAIFFSGFIPQKLMTFFFLQLNTFWVGDVVRVIDDMETVKRFQPGHGEWTDEMAPVSARQFQDSPVTS